MAVSVASASLVDIASPTDRARTLSDLLARIVGPDSAPVLTEEAGYTELIESSLDLHGQVFKNAGDEETEGYFLLLFSLLPALPASQLAGTYQAITNALLSASERATLRLKIVVNFFNTLSDPVVKVDIFKALIGFAIDTKQVELLLPYFPTVLNWETKAGLPSKVVRPVYLLISKAYSKVGDAEQAQVFLLKYLHTFDNETEESVLAESRDAAKDAALGFIRAPAVSQKSALVTLRAIQALATDRQHAKLHELLTIFSSKDIDAYKAFHAANPGYLESAGIDHEASLETMRLLTLCSLAAAKPTLTYDAIATGIQGFIHTSVHLLCLLQCPASEVESWVVLAISRGLIDARMDQAASTVTVQKSLQREFGAAQWNALRSTLAAWQENVGSLLHTVATGSA